MHVLARFAIGQQYQTCGKHPVLCTVVDIHTTYNAQGEHVRTRYVATHDFCGQTVKGCDLPEATIARGLSNEELAKIDGRN